MISSYAIPCVILLCAFILFFSKDDYYKFFATGAKRGFLTAVKLLPTLVILMCAVGMFNASGAMSLITKLTSGVFKALGVPTEILPLIVVRPVSGSAATVMLNDIFAKYGTDSFAGRCASLMAGSTDTILYTFAVYFSCVGIKNTRHGLWAAFLAQLFCILLSCRLVEIFWG